MSHAATNWAIQQRGLKPGSKIVLWHLADRHNPDMGCFPSQERLAEDCEMSRSTVNEHLKCLEANGLIRRERRKTKGSNRQMSTRYYFPFEDAFHHVEVEDSPCPETGHGLKPDDMAQDGAKSDKVEADSHSKTVSDFGADPSPEIAESRVRKPGQEPVREPLKEPCASSASRSQAFEEFWDCFPRPRNRQRTKELWEQALMAGADPAEITAGAKEYAQENAWKGANRRGSIYFSDNWLECHAWEPKKANPKRSSREDLARLWAGYIKAGEYVPPSAIKADLAREMVAAGLVGADELRERGIEF